MYANIGIIGIVKEEMEQDYWGTCQKLADLGYKAVENGPPEDEDVAASMKRLGDMGLQYLAGRANRYTVEEEIDGIIDQAGAYNLKYIIVYWGPADSKEEVLADAAMYNRVGAKCAAKGLKLCYHNHDHEFTTLFDGKSVFDLYLENTDPDKVYFELDTAWVTFGGADPVKILHENRGRIPIVHLKDLSDLEQRGHFTTVGTGLVNTKGIMQAAKDTDVEWVVIEQDSLNNMTGIETAAGSIYNLRELGFVEPTYIAPPEEKK
ncbi:MAG TPA: sugar phosphate isomerase/epimerase [Phycisphaerae bacterium]|nr:sugar phosphate isomerase/epimerase [Phycisphaerae bacterium]